ncbi:MAG: alpha/beta fold hydrolase [Candidatus Dormibacteria bacterium]
MSATANAGLTRFLPPVQEPWTSHTVDLGSPIHYADFGGAGQVMVLVHGIASSHLNWMGIGEELAKSFRVFAVDLPGYGLSPRGEAPATVQNSQAFLDRFIDHVSPGAPVLLFGHSMGGLVAMLEASAHAEKVSRLLLLSPAAPYPRVSLAVAFLPGFLAAAFLPRRSAAVVRRGGQRLDPDRVVRDVFGRIIAPTSEVSEEILVAHVDLLRRQREEHDWTELALVESAGSLLKTTVRRKRFRAMVEAISSPTLLMHGTRDRLVPYRAGVLLHRCRPDWSWRPLARLGHMAQMEGADLVLATVHDWLAARAILETAA